MAIYVTSVVSTRTRPGDDSDDTAHEIRAKQFFSELSSRSFVRVFRLFTKWISCELQRSRWNVTLARNFDAVGACALAKSAPVCFALISGKLSHWSRTTDNRLRPVPNVRHVVVTTVFHVTHRAPEGCRDDLIRLHLSRRRPSYNGG